MARMLIKIPTSRALRQISLITTTLLNHLYRCAYLLSLLHLTHPLRSSSIIVKFPLRVNFDGLVFESQISITVIVKADAFFLLVLRR